MSKTPIEFGSFLCANISGLFHDKIESFITNRKVLLNSVFFLQKFHQLC